MKHIFWIVVSLFVSINAFAGEGYREGEYEKEIVSYIKKLNKFSTNNLDELSESKKSDCENSYQKILQDGVLDIRMALGYFDHTIGEKMVYYGKNYGYSPSDDITLAKLLKKYLLRSCNGQSMYCGFKEISRGVLEREVKIHSRPVLVRVQIQNASVSEFHSMNTGKLYVEQNQRSADMDQYFAEALQSADIVIYDGHSRDGGGPDFHPPVFVKGRNKVDYRGYYKVHQPGLKKVLSALEVRQPAVLALLSCNSEDHFLKALQKAAPDAGFLLTTLTLQRTQTFRTAIGTIDAFMRGQCRESFKKQIQLYSSSQSIIAVDGRFF